MSQRSQQRKDDLLGFVDGPSTRPRDLLSYKDMDIEMSRWALTDTGWASVFALLGITFACFIITVVLALIGLL